MVTSSAARDPRPVIEGASLPLHESVRRARDLLREGQGALAGLASAIAEGLERGWTDVLFERPDRLLYSTDASIYEMEPLAVVFPRSAADIRHVLKVAGERNVPVLPRGAATSLSGQTVNHAVVIDCSRYMNKVLEVDPAGRWAKVQPGVVIDQLNREVRRYGLHYPIDPATKNRSTIGGGIANNSCGTHSVIYGKTIDHVVDLDVLLADGTPASFGELSGAALEAKLGLGGLEGEAYRATLRLGQQHATAIAERYPKIQRRVSGYNLDEFTGGDSVNLARLVVGSEGTLAFVTAARVRLEPLPALRGLVAVHFRTVADACAAVMQTLSHRPAAVELVDSTIIERCRESVGFRSLVDFVIGEPGALLLVELFDDEKQSLTARLDEAVRDLAGQTGAYGSHVTTDPAEQLRIWRMREAGLGILMSIKGDAKPVAIVEDTAVPPERLWQWVVAFDEIVRRYGTTAAYYGHASVGCLHIRPLVNLKTVGGLTAAYSLASDIADMVLEYGGSLSGEHGDGIVRGVFTERMFGAELTNAFRELKHAWDPRGLLNPGKIIDTPPFTDNLRLGPDTRNSTPKTYLDFSADGGLARSVELCNGQAACRKFDGGMCPSFMVTENEEHSTRGRANLLRQALNGVIPADQLADRRVYEALDLCVECKACKSECPSGVDMAKIKSEVLTAYHERNGTPLRARLFGRIATVSSLSTRVRPVIPLINRAKSLRLTRVIIERALGIHRARTLPPLARRPFRHWFRAHQKRVGERMAPRGEAVFFDDTLTRYHHTDVGRAAVRVLEALGYTVLLAERLGCCGRPLISKGQLGLARNWALREVERLTPYVTRGLPVVGVEPSCLLTLRDEYPDLLGDVAIPVASRAVLLDELVVRLANEDPAVRESFHSLGRRRALVHVHCHQKALVGVEPTLRALALIPDLEVELVQSACCGMAGSFGFEAEHYDVSRAMAMRSLVPAVDAAAADTDILVTGASCRQQLMDFSSRRPRHVAELLAESLARQREL